MKSITLTPKNPFINIKGDTIKIKYNGQNYHFEIGDILSVYLKKTKPAYVPQFVASAFSALGKRYKLYIRTHDLSETQIKVNAEEKHYFISLISQIKRFKTKNDADLAS